MKRALFAAFAAIAGVAMTACEPGTANVAQELKGNPWCEGGGEFCEAEPTEIKPWDGKDMPPDPKDAQDFGIVVFDVALKRDKGNDDPTRVAFAIVDGRAVWARSFRIDKQRSLIAGLDKTAWRFLHHIPPLEPPPPPPPPPVIEFQYYTTIALELHELQKVQMKQALERTSACF